MKSASPSRPDFNRSKRREQRFSFRPPFPLFAPVLSSLANAWACLLVLARLVLLSATASVATVEVLLTLFICGSYSAAGCHARAAPGCPSPSGCESARSFHAL